MNPLVRTQISRVRPLFEYLKKQQDNRKFVHSIEISATFVLITFFMVFALRPTILTISALKGDIESKKILKEELRNKINQVVTAQDLFSQVQERYQIVNSGLPDHPNYYEAADIIEQTGKKYDIPVDSLAFDLENSTTDVSPDVQTYSIHTMVNGPFINAVNLATEILKNRRADYINILNLATADDSQTSDSTSSAKPGISTKFSTAFYFWPSTK
jgi:hypothetical protein